MSSGACISAVTLRVTKPGVRAGRAVQGREVFQKWTLRAQSGPQGQAEASALGRFTWDGVEDGIAILVLGQVDRQNLGQGGDEVVDLADVEEVG